MPTCSECGSSQAKGLTPSGRCLECGLKDDTLPPADNAPGDINAGVAARIATERQVLELRLAKGEHPTSWSLMAAQNMTHHRTLNYLRAVAVSNPGAVLPPAIVKELGGVEYVVDCLASLGAGLLPEALHHRLDVALGRPSPPRRGEARRDDGGERRLAAQLARAAPQLAPKDGLT